MKLVICSNLLSVQTNQRTHLLFRFSSCNRILIANFTFYSDLDVYLLVYRSMKQAYKHSSIKSEDKAELWSDKAVHSNYCYGSYTYCIYCSLWCCVLFYLSRINCSPVPASELCDDNGGCYGCGDGYVVTEYHTCSLESKVPLSVFPSSPWRQSNPSTLSASIE